MKELEIIPGVQGESLFPDEAQYERFRESFSQVIIPVLQGFADQHRRSEEDSRGHLVS